MFNLELLYGIRGSTFVLFDINIKILEEQFNCFDDVLGW